MITLLITGFEEASNFRPWRSTQVLAPIVASVPFLLAFLLHERFMTLKKSGTIQPIFPWRLNTFSSGAVFTSCIIQIQFRFQAVNNESPWQAGLRLIPFGVAVPIGATLTAVICGNKRLPIIYMMFSAFFLQALDAGFMSTMNIHRFSWNGQYGLQFLAGTGCGFAVGSVRLMMPAAIEKGDLVRTATSTSAVVQLRMLGRALDLALVTANMKSRLKYALEQFLSHHQVRKVFKAAETIPHLPEPVKTLVREAFLRDYNTQLHILVGLAAAQIPATFLIWEKEPVKIH
ncbi:hypothetical protein BS50DRAFT_599082 [Corynespora cassiicola Philippines]|uniref:MFS general substrate transporter n=1 Tax=Corynespora cassiicola Philippines TaxID=1448308 RepID=A0A2T2NYK3_CORCC|nr:hypothetical protein BS50DRAFT_599082 [Corynespora cassiicola Philippines]